MRVLALDSETTGLPRYDRRADDPCQPRICSLGYVLFDPETPDGADISVYDLVKPDGWTVPPDVVAIHGLSTEKLLAEGNLIRDVLDRFLVAWELADQLTGFNLHFDLKLLRGELRRCGLSDHYGEKPEICALRASDRLCRIAPTDKMMAAGYRKNKIPKLHEAYQILLGKRLEGAHNALMDARATVEIYRWLKANKKLPPATWNSPKLGA